MYIPNCKILSETSSTGASLHNNGERIGLQIVKQIEQSEKSIAPKILT